MSTPLKARPAVARMREEAVAGQTEPQYCSTSKTQNTQTIINNPQPPLPAQQRTIYHTPSEQSHVPDRCSCKIKARHAELSRRPCPCCTVVHIHNIRSTTTCSGARERGRGRRANRTATLHHAQTINTHAKTNIFQPLPAQTTHLRCNPQRTKPRSRQMQLQDSGAPR